MWRVPPSRLNHSSTVRGRPLDLPRVVSQMYGWLAASSGRCRGSPEGADTGSDMARGYHRSAAVRGGTRLWEGRGPRDQGAQKSSTIRVVVPAAATPIPTFRYAAFLKFSQCPPLVDFSACMPRWVASTMPFGV
jgi:hypothetical protein